MEENQNGWINVIAGVAMLGFLVWLSIQMAVNPANAQVLILLGVGMGLAVLALMLAFLPALFRRRDRDPDRTATG
jgi:predicted phage tail protein